MDELLYEFEGINLNEFFTDKLTYHNYVSIYKMFFDSIDCKNLLEIGVNTGDSLRMFNKIFPNASIYGIDIEDKSIYDTEKIKTYIADQSNREQLSQFIESVNVHDFDIILDDGGHTQTQQQISLATLFSKVKSGGIYILEDLHASFMDTHMNPITNKPLYNPDNNPIKTFDMLRKYQKTKKIESVSMTQEEIKYLEENIYSVCIWSRTKDYSTSVTSIILKK